MVLSQRKHSSPRGARILEISRFFPFSREVDRGSTI
jgi:hypothetical protein